MWWLIALAHAAPVLQLDGAHHQQSISLHRQDVALQYNGTRHLSGPVLEFKVKQRSTIGISAFLPDSHRSGDSEFDELRLITPEKMSYTMKFNTNSYRWADTSAGNATHGYTVFDLDPGTYSLQFASMTEGKNSSNYAIQIDVVDLSMNLSNTAPQGYGIAKIAGTDDQVLSGTIDGKRRDQFPLGAGDFGWGQGIYLPLAPSFRVELPKNGVLVYLDTDHDFISGGLFLTESQNAKVEPKSWNLLGLAPGEWSFYPTTQQNSDVRGDIHYSLRVVGTDPKELSLPKQLTQNPTAIDHLVNTAVDSEVAVQGQGCSPDTTRADAPAAHITLPAGLRASQWRLHRGWGTGVYVQDGTGRGWCDETPALEAGELWIYPLRSGGKFGPEATHPDGAIYADIRVEHMDLPRDPAWREVVEVSPAKRTWVAVKGDEAQSERSSGTVAGRDAIPQWAVGALRITEPTRELMALPALGEQSQILLKGPYNALNRPAEHFGTYGVRDLLDPGTYQVMAATFDNPEFVAAGEVWFGFADTFAASTAPAATPAPQAWEQRALSQHIPRLPATSVPLFDVRLFGSAPLKLFVHPKTNVGVDVLASYSSSEGLLANEPLLVTGYNSANQMAHVVASDGARFEVPVRYLAPGLPATLAFPDHVRNLEITDRNLEEVATAEDQALVASLRKKQQAFDACQDRVWSKYDVPGSAWDWSIVTYSDGRVVGSENLGEKASDEAWKTCGGAGLTATQEQVFADVERHLKVKILDEIKAVRTRLEAGK